MLRREHGHADWEKQPPKCSGMGSAQPERSLKRWILISLEGLSTLTRWQIPHYLDGLKLVSWLMPILTNTCK